MHARSAHDPARREDSLVADHKKTVRFRFFHLNRITTGVRISISIPSRIAGRVADLCHGRREVQRDAIVHARSNDRNQGLSSGSCKCTRIVSRAEPAPGPRYTPSQIICVHRSRNLALIILRSTGRSRLYQRPDRPLGRESCPDPAWGSEAAGTSSTVRVGAAEKRARGGDSQGPPACTESLPKVFRHAVVGRAGEFRISCLGATYPSSDAVRP